LTACATETCSIALAGIALLCAALMGLAIQRGGLCMVAAVDQIASRRGAGRALGLLEAAVLVSLVTAAAMLAGADVRPVPDYRVEWVVLLGGMLLGIGATLNGACLMGTIARLGSGDWHYALTPAGFLAGSYAGARLMAAPGRLAPIERPGLLGLAAAGLLILLLFWRRVDRRRRSGAETVQAPDWLAGHATLVIGLLSGVLLLLAGAWAYSNVLIRIARGGGAGGLDIALFAALFAGAIAGGSGFSAHIRLRLCTALACFTGGALMGLGATLAPGGNDSLILFGLPLLRPYAWLAIAVMALTIWVGLLLRSRLVHYRGGS